MCTEACSSFGEIRLVGGSSAKEGRVEVCDGSVWGTVCDDSWGTPDAQVVCRQLGYVTTGAIARGSAFFGSGVGPVTFDDVGCTGSEMFLANCSRASTHNCAHTEDAGVTCSGML